MKITRSSEVEWVEALKRGRYDNRRKALGGDKLSAGLWELPAGKRSFPMHAHLVTEEACNIYRSIVQADGVLAFHITNRYLNLEPVLATLARRAQWSGFRYDFRELSSLKGIDEQTGETVSAWVMLSARPSNLGALTEDRHLQPIVEKPGQRVWTDDYSNLLSVFE